MLKKRVIPTLLFKDVGLVKGISFDSWRRVGTAMQSVKVYNVRDVDELMFLDISATDAGREPDYEAINELADECFVPLTVGGGVRNIEDVRRLLLAGADKVAINSAAVDDTELIARSANRFGSQCVVISIDTKYVNGEHKVFTHSGKKETRWRACDWAKQAENLGAGEILLTSIDRDGTMSGYDLGLIRSVVDNVSIPVIASGGAGCYEDMEKALRVGGASAVAAASIYHFTEQTPLEAKRYLKARGVPVRLF